MGHHWTADGAMGPHWTVDGSSWLTDMQPPDHDSEWQETEFATYEWWSAEDLMTLVDEGVVWSFDLGDGVSTWETKREEYVTGVRDEHYRMQPVDMSEGFDTTRPILLGNPPFNDAWRGILDGHHRIVAAADAGVPVLVRVTNNFDLVMDSRSGARVGPQDYPLVLPLHTVDDVPPDVREPMTEEERDESW